MGILSNIYLLDKSQFIEMILNGSFQSKGETVTFDHLGIYYITGPISSEMIDTYGTNIVFPTQEQIANWNLIAGRYPDWENTDSTSVDYIKNKPESSTIDVLDGRKDSISVTLPGGKTLYDLSNLVTSLKTVDGIPLTPAGSAIIDSVNYFDTPPTEDYTSSTYIRFAVLEEEPDEIFDGYIYYYPDSE